jgi:hypothetical protein
MDKVQNTISSQKVVVSTSNGVMKHFLVSDLRDEIDMQREIRAGYNTEVQ